MKEEENIGIVKQLYDAYERHDISSVLDMFTDHAVLHGPAPAGVLPWGGIYDSRGSIADFFKALGESLETHQFELLDFIAQGNKVVVVGYQRGRTQMAAARHPHIAQSPFSTLQLNQTYVLYPVNFLSSLIA
jgi:uncharacterized protein